MKSNFTRAFFWAFFFIMIVACKPAAQKSNVSYFTVGTAGLTATAGQPSVTICVNYPGQRDDDITRAATMWYQGLNNGSDNIPQIQVTADDGNCAAWVSLEDLGGGAAYTEIGDNPTIHWDINGGTWFGSPEVLVHEFGHGFGLGDTYNMATRQAGDCVAGEPPQAIMCNPTLQVPQQDDIDGIRAVAGGDFSSTYPDYNALGLGQTNPWSGGGGSGGSNGSGGSGGVNNGINGSNQTGGTTDPLAALFTYLIQSLMGGNNAVPQTTSQNTTINPGDPCPSSIVANIDTSAATLQNADLNQQNTNYAAAVIVQGLQNWVSATATICLDTYQNCLNPHVQRALLTPYNANGVMVGVAYLYQTQFNMLRQYGGGIIQSTAMNGTPFFCKLTVQ